MSKSLLAPILTRNQRLSVRRGQGAGNGRAAYVFEAGPRNMPSTMMLNGCQLRKRYRTQTRRSEERCGREQRPVQKGSTALELSHELSRGFFHSEAAGEVRHVDAWRGQRSSTDHTQP